MTADLSVERVSKSFGQTKVLDDISLSVEPGEFVSLVGASGCGKSTLLRIIAGLEAQDQGDVAIAGRSVSQLSPSARNVAMVFQNYALYPHMSVFDNVALPLTMRQLSIIERLPLVRLASPRRSRIAAEIAGKVGSVASQLRIDHLLDRKPGQLSGGQRQRVALARALVREPSLFLMDEPLSNLDAQLRVQMRDEIADLHARLGATFIYVTHDQVEAMTLSHRVALLEAGRIAQIGRPIELYDRPATISVACFIGSPAINILPAQISAGGRLTYAGTPLPIAVDGSAGAAASIGLRPEHATISAPFDGALLIARVRRSEHHGPEQLVHVEIQSAIGGSLTIRVPDSHPETAEVTAGNLVSVSFDPRRLHVFDAQGQRLSTRLFPQQPSQPAKSRKMAGAAV
ncbi:ABC transporter ATP-binding protein [Mesorhizobium sp. BAC0120]|uniref:ABC transporter ATP-binding protein n=1 Tax=Mesorhizobium sp. BAC0120 TaxID=3090670 RepID=UPI00298C9865|nr:ABC transporter ATP-binding protein [Mesorhizobium sp. BAC0120]MDW6023048.1 ABC transporter ATP-binding protein [Mesorhizobium sp. BAC0120]